MLETDCRKILEIQMEASRVEEIYQKLERIYVGEFWKLGQDFYEVGDKHVGVNTRNFEGGKIDLSQWISK